MRKLIKRNEREKELAGEILNGVLSALDDDFGASPEINANKIIAAYLAQYGDELLYSPEYAGLRLDARHKRGAIREARFCAARN